MHESSDTTTTIPAPSRDLLTEILRDGAQRLLGQAVEAEVADWIGRHAGVADAWGRQQVVRNGHHPPRTLVTGVGAVLSDAAKEDRVGSRYLLSRQAGKACQKSTLGGA